MWKQKPVRIELILPLSEKLAHKKQIFMVLLGPPIPVAIVENLGEFSKVAPPGLSCIWCPFVSVAGRLSLRVQQLDIRCETKTKDNVFVNVQVSERRFCERALWQ